MDAAELNAARDALLDEAKKRADKGDLKGSADLLDKAVEPLRHSGSYHYARGGVAIRLGDLDRAISEFTAACELDPEVAEFHGNLGGALLEKARADQSLLPRAKEVLLRAVSLSPRLPDVHNNLGTAQLASGDAKAALASFDAALRLNGRHVPTLYNRAAALKALGRMDEAKKTLDACLAVDPSFAPAKAAKAKL